ncbi:restriction endonuclease subunit S (plasmid) [Aeromonas media]|uniref:Restriction endonuclease subunit S n=2 Tax=Aeromonas TaxID=642 RepID=A0A3S5WX95_AERCA|nr:MULTISPECIES: restriction endonuclease subunit S [Gammaproteobacteria]AXB03656.1 restriction endonuclease subunit S [Aeromonas caviae]AXB04253.1 restriction endonuclease subunit S [Aeromonas caviae]AXB06447.1 restriction endonuclease subunit S [Aeromonas caviae]AXB06582.1 restriction endonuclease subunit S [Aeromonas caviae]AXB07208.1 restriction endonuclease subunit S [Aeromonas caviae]
MSQYRAYPAYKDSGIEWIGQVPEHWKVARVKRLASLRNERRNDVSTDTIYIGLEDVEAGSGQYKPTNGSSRQSEDSTVGIFYEGDVLYGKLRPYLRKAIISEMAGCCSTEFLVLRAEKTEPRWLQEWLLTPDVTHQIESGCEGAKMPRADWGHIGSIEVVYPDQPEQAKILTTLDRETARIDALVEKKNRFIELLKEKRQALITHAVTKGLDPNVKMKDSGVEWIGLVPEHWDVKPFFALVTELNRKNVGLVETNILSLSYGNIIQKPETRNMGLTPESYETYQIVESGETVFRFTDLQNDKHSLRSALVTQRGIITSAYMAVKPHSIDSTYFAWLMRSYDLCKVFYAMGGGLRQSLKFEDVRRLPVLIPPVDEQSAITNTINAGTARIDALVEKTEQSITLLKERRAAFITAAVTGQIDLRGKQ